MKFISIREFRSNTPAVRKELKEQKDLVLTANGRPFAILTNVDADGVEEELSAIRRARARVALDKIRSEAKSKGLNKLTMKQIDKIIADDRRGRRSVTGGKK